MTNGDAYALFKAAVTRMDNRYDRLLYGERRIASSEARAKLGVWVHERWRTLFHEWLNERMLPPR